MARIDLVAGGASRVLPVAAHTVLGRAPSCTFAVPGAGVPSLWLELRWFSGPDIWAWRPLREPDPTEGRRIPARGLPVGWYALRGEATLSIPGAASLRLVEAGPPAAFAVDARTGDLAEGEAFDALVVRLSDGPWPVDADEQDDPAGPIPDGGLFLARGRWWRLFDAVPPGATDAGGIDLRHPSCLLTLVRGGTGEWVLQLTQRKAEIRIEEAPVRVLVPFAEAKAREGDGDGWLSRLDVYERWLALGGDPRSPEERMAVDRARLLRRIAERGVRGGEALFDAPEKRHGRYYMRCALPAGRIVVVE